MRALAALLLVQQLYWEVIASSSFRSQNRSRDDEDPEAEKASARQRRRRSLLSKDSTLSILSQAMLITPGQNLETQKGLRRGSETKALVSKPPASASSSASNSHSHSNLKTGKGNKATTSKAAAPTRNEGESPTDAKKRRKAMEKARESLGKDLGGRLAQALSKAGERKRVLAHSVHQKDREVSDRAFAQSVGFETTAGQQRLRDKFALKILNAALQAMEEQPPQKEASQPSQLLLQPKAPPSVVIGVMGTSVTAGHDNWFNESWPVVLGDLLRRPFSAAFGVGVEVRNHAIGGNRYEPSAHCIEATVGPDVDIFGFEFNMIFHGPAAAFELFIRNTLSLPSTVR